MSVLSEGQEKNYDSVRTTSSWSRFICLRSTQSPLYCLDVLSLVTAF